MSLDCSQSFVNYYKKEMIGQIDIDSANRLYEMANKETNQREDYFKNVSIFYF